MKGPTYELRAKVWLYPGMTGWHFVDVNKKASREIKANFGHGGRGFGSIPVIVTVGQTSWKTSIVPDKKSDTYLLPLKAEVRQKEDIQSGEIINYSIEIII